MGSPVAVYFFAFSKLFFASFSSFFSIFLLPSSALLLFSFCSASLHFLVFTNRTYNNISCERTYFFCQLQAASSFQNRLFLFNLFLPAPDCLQNQLQTASRTTSSSSLLLFFLFFLFFLSSIPFPWWGTTWEVQLLYIFLLFQNFFLPASLLVVFFYFSSSSVSSPTGRTTTSAADLFFLPCSRLLPASRTASLFF